ncbi:uncharacterized protein AKAW2_20527A [Aspergillus luchuensis]|uniref:Uncharacterized protein n=1 Tax=Aspergillus kawachii TaxID=1069201 RepID=A0A7R7W394_ASPKA|nr:uncharacterized protein AKAW2_20527A [Aspergillus luchuensis]BCR95587.1 hypothetical protein AKAW2_20527A [Aspergillus luchuensis]
MSYGVVCIPKERLLMQPVRRYDRQMIPRWTHESRMVDSVHPHQLDTTSHAFAFSQRVVMTRKNPVPAGHTNHGHPQTWMHRVSAPIAGVDGTKNARLIRSGVSKSPPPNLPPGSHHWPMALP